MGQIGELTHNQSVAKRRVAAALAFAGALNPLPVPLAGLHKFYLGYPRWGVIYLLLNWTQIPRIACMLEGCWYLLPGSEYSTPMAPLAHSSTTQINLAQQVQFVTTTIRDLEQLRQEGLLTEWEFEQQRRQLLEPLND